MPETVKVKLIEKNIKRRKQEVIRLSLGCFMNGLCAKAIFFFFFLQNAIRSMDGSVQMSWVRDKESMPILKR